MCGQCVLHSTGMTCPMNCPKTLRNGPCGGVRPDGHCEVKPEMRCVWVKAVERAPKTPWAHEIHDLRPAGRQPALEHVVVGEPAHEARQGRAEGLACRGLRRRSPPGRFVVTAELLTVNTGGLDAVRERFAPFEDWVDAVNATDNTAAHAHASPLAVAIALKQLGMEPVMQLVCRDRNRLALQAEIAGAALHGIENICCLTGDDVTAGDEPEARRVFDLDSIQLLAIADAMRNGRYLSGRKIDPPPHLFLGAVENPRRAAVRPPRRPRAEEGARRRALPPAPGRASSPSRSRRFMARGGREGARRAVRRSCRRSASSRSPRALRFIDENVPGISVPAETDRALRARRRPRGRVLRGRLRARRARALAARASRGLHLISFRNEAGIARLCRRLGIPTRARKGDEWRRFSSRRLGRS